MKTPSLRAALVVVLALAGLTAVAEATWIPAKAFLAQRLLDKAWRRTVDAASPTPGEGSSATGYRPWRSADTWPVARLEIPGPEGRRRSLVVLDGASGQSLAFGPGLFHRTARTIAIAGHRDTHFGVLRDTAIGDLVHLELAGEPIRTYQIESTSVVDHRETWTLEDPLVGERLTLVTCYPFDTLVPGGPLRFVVRAERISTPSPSRIPNTPHPKEPTT